MLILATLTDPCKPRWQGGYILADTHLGCTYSIKLQDAQKVTHLLRLRSTNGAAPEVILMSTGSKLRRTAGPSSDPAMVHSGSEVHLMVQAHQELAASGVKVRPGFRDFLKSCH